MNEKMKKEVREFNEKIRIMTKILKEKFGMDDEQIDIILYYAVLLGKIWKETKMKKKMKPETKEKIKRVAEGLLIGCTSAARVYVSLGLR